MNVVSHYFRIFPETFEMILATIGAGLRAINNALSGRKSIPERKQLLIAIWFMATPDSYRYLCGKIYITIKIVTLYLIYMICMYLFQICSNEIWSRQSNCFSSIETCNICSPLCCISIYYMAKRSGCCKCNGKIRKIMRLS